MSPRIFALAAQAGLALAAWWLTRSDAERRMMQAGLWREVETLAMGWAKNASDLAAYASEKYKQTAMV